MATNDSFPWPRIRPSTGVTFGGWHWRANTSDIKMLAIVAASHPEAPLSPSLTTGLIQETTHRVWFSMVLRVLTQVLAIHYGTVWTCFDQKKTWGYWSAPRHFPGTLGTSSRNYRDFPQSFRAFLSQGGAPNHPWSTMTSYWNHLHFGNPRFEEPPRSQRAARYQGRHKVLESEIEIPKAGWKNAPKDPWESPKILQLV